MNNDRLTSVFVCDRYVTHENGTQLMTRRIYLTAAAAKAMRTRDQKRYEKDMAWHQLMIVNHPNRPLPHQSRCDVYELTTTGIVPIP